MKKTDLRKFNFDAECEFDHSSNKLTTSLDFLGIDCDGEVDYWDELHSIIAESWNNHERISGTFEELISSFNKLIGHPDKCITIKEVILVYLAFQLGRTVVKNRPEKELKAIIATLMN